MKKVLSIVAIAAVMLVAGKANAQTTIHAGFQSGTVSASGNGVTAISDDGVSGFYAGIDYNVAVSGDDFGIAPGVMFSYYSDMMDIRVPVMFNWREQYNAIEVGVQAGPVLSYGVGGDMYKDGTFYKRFDIGVGAGVWVGYQKFRIEAGYTYGLLNRLNDDGKAFFGNDISVKFHKVYVGLGFTL